MQSLEAYEQKTMDLLMVVETKTRQTLTIKKFFLILKLLNLGLEAQESTLNL